MSPLGDFCVWWYTFATRLPTHMECLESNNLIVTRRTTGKLPLLPYLKIKEAILGKKYRLDISFVDTATSAQLHIEYKKKPGPANTLAFPYSDSDGEIIMHLETIRRQARIYDRSYHQHLMFLCIHSMLHLKGFKHGNEMEEMENKFYKKFLPKK